jgi:hypothetical protein
MAGGPAGLAACTRQPAAAAALPTAAILGILEGGLRRPPIAIMGEG